MKRSRRLAAAMAAAATVTAIGASGAVAQALPLVGNESPQHVRTGPKPPDPRPTMPPETPRGCHDLDSVVVGTNRYLSVVCNGQVYVLTVNVSTEQADPSGWRLVAGLNNVVDAELTAEGPGTVRISALTAVRTVVEVGCIAGLPLGTCTAPTTLPRLP
ncbi:hypothetical protein GCM10010508_46450 [Streptomyces naganishii JCM 4654]|uniref:Secreted protein n=2 Tax=Streptomyces naganishii TaxID=285447 RepID=A0A918Y7B8_9ACTN|nr:hypothetical protein GCM10010508_46450 [Streptomyces naganishii JCM 4654]